MNSSNYSVIDPDKRKYFCSICGNYLSSEKNLRRHKTNLHGISESYCEICDLVLTDYLELTKHKMSHEESVSKTTNELRLEDLIICHTQPELTNTVANETNKVPLQSISVDETQSQILQLQRAIDLQSTSEKDFYLLQEGMEEFDQTKTVVMIDDSNIALIDDSNISDGEQTYIMTETDGVINLQPAGTDLVFESDTVDDKPTFFRIKDNQIIQILDPESEAIFQDHQNQLHLAQHENSPKTSDSVTESDKNSGVIEIQSDSTVNELVIELLASAANEKPSEHSLSQSFMNTNLSQPLNCVSSTITSMSSSAVNDALVNLVRDTLSFSNVHINDNNIMEINPSLPQADNDVTTAISTTNSVSDTSVQPKFKLTKTDNQSNISTTNDLELNEMQKTTVSEANFVTYSNSDAVPLFTSNLNTLPLNEIKINKHTSVVTFSKYSNLNPSGSDKNLQVENNQQKETLVETVRNQNEQSTASSSLQQSESSERLKTPQSEFSERRKTTKNLKHQANPQSKEKLNSVETIPVKERRETKMKNIKVSKTVRNVFRKTKSTTENVCDICNGSFSSTSLLETHLKTHNVKKPFQCKAGICFKSFTQISSLYVHQLSHGKGKKFLCEFCGKSYSRPFSLQRHLKGIHNIHQKYKLCDIVSTDEWLKYLHRFTQKKNKRNDNGNLSFPAKSAVINSSQSLDSDSPEDDDLELFQDEYYLPLDSDEMSFSSDSESWLNADLPPNQKEKIEILDFEDVVNENDDFNEDSQSEYSSDVLSNSDSFVASISDEEWEETEDLASLDQKEELLTNFDKEINKDLEDLGVDSDTQLFDENVDPDFEELDVLEFLNLKSDSKKNKKIKHGKKSSPQLMDILEESAKEIFDNIKSTGLGSKSSGTQYLPSKDDIVFTEPSLYIGPVAIGAVDENDTLMDMLEYGAKIIFKENVIKPLNERPEGDKILLEFDESLDTKKIPHQPSNVPKHNAISKTSVKYENESCTLKVITTEKKSTNSFSDVTSQIKNGNFPKISKDVTITVVTSGNELLSANHIEMKKPSHEIITVQNNSRKVKHTTYSSSNQEINSMKVKSGTKGKSRSEGNAVENATISNKSDYQGDLKLSDAANSIPQLARISPLNSGDRKGKQKSPKKVHKANTGVTRSMSKGNQLNTLVKESYAPNSDWAQVICGRLQKARKSFPVSINKPLNTKIANKNKMKTTRPAKKSTVTSFKKSVKSVKHSKSLELLHEKTLSALQSINNVPKESSTFRQSVDLMLSQKIAGPTQSNTAEETDAMKLTPELSMKGNLLSTSIQTAEIPSKLHSKNVTKPKSSCKISTYQKASSSVNNPGVPANKLAVSKNLMDAFDIYQSHARINIQLKATSSGKKSNSEKNDHLLSLNACQINNKQPELTPTLTNMPSITSSIASTSTTGNISKPHIDTTTKVNNLGSLQENKNLESSSEGTLIRKVSVPKNSTKPFQAVVPTIKINPKKTELPNKTLFGDQVYDVLKGDKSTEFNIGKGHKKNSIENIKGARNIKQRSQTARKSFPCVQSNAMKSTVTKETNKDTIKKKEMIILPQSTPDSLYSLSNLSSGSITLDETRKNSTRKRYSYRSSYGRRNLSQEDTHTSTFKKTPSLPRSYSRCRNSNASFSTDMPKDEIKNVDFCDKTLKNPNIIETFSSLEPNIFDDPYLDVTSPKQSSLPTFDECPFTLKLNYNDAHILDFTMPELNPIELKKPEFIAKSVFKHIFSSSETNFKVVTSSSDVPTSQVENSKLSEPHKQSRKAEYIPGTYQKIRPKSKTTNEINNTAMNSTIKQKSSNNESSMIPVNSAIKLITNDCHKRSRTPVYSKVEPIATVSKETSITPINSAIEPIISTDKESRTAPANSAIEPISTDNKERSTAPVNSGIEPISTDNKERSTAPVNSGIEPISTDCKESNATLINSAIEPISTDNKESSTTPVNSRIEPISTDSKESNTTLINSVIEPISIDSKDSSTTPVISAIEPIPTVIKESCITTPVNSATEPIVFDNNDSKVTFVNSVVKTTATNNNESGTTGVNRTSQTIPTTNQRNAIPESSTTKPIPNINQIKIISTSSVGQAPSTEVEYDVNNSVGSIMHGISNQDQNEATSTIPENRNTAFGAVSVGNVQSFSGNSQLDGIKAYLDFLNSKAEHSNLCLELNEESEDGTSSPTFAEKANYRTNFSSNSSTRKVKSKSNFNAIKKPLEEKRPVTRSASKKVSLCGTSNSEYTEKKLSKENPPPAISFKARGVTNLISNDGVRKKENKGVNRNKSEHIRMRKGFTKNDDNLKDTNLGSENPTYSGYSTSEPTKTNSSETREQHYSNKLKVLKREFNINEKEVERSALQSFGEEKPEISGIASKSTMPVVPLRPTFCLKPVKITRTLNKSSEITYRNRRDVSVCISQPQQSLNILKKNKKRKLHFSPPKSNSSSTFVSEKTISESSMQKSMKSFKSQSKKAMKVEETYHLASMPEVAEHNLNQSQRKRKLALCEKSEWHSLIEIRPKIRRLRRKMPKDVSLNMVTEDAIDSSNGVSNQPARNRKRRQRSSEELHDSKAQKIPIITKTEERVGGPLCILEEKVQSKSKIAKIKTTSQHEKNIKDFCEKSQPKLSNLVVKSVNTSGGVNSVKSNVSHRQILKANPQSAEKSKKPTQSEVKCDHIPLTFYGKTEPEKDNLESWFVMQKDSVCNVNIRVPVLSYLTSFKELRVHVVNCSHLVQNNFSVCS